MRMYKTSTAYLSKDIEEVEVVKTTPSFVYLQNGNRVAKRSNYERYFETFEEAKDSLVKEYHQKISKALHNIERLNEDMERYKVKIAEIKGLEP